MEPVEKTRWLIDTMGYTGSDIDIAINHMGVTQAQYRKQYPETPVTYDLVMLVYDAISNGEPGKETARKLSITKSQYNTARYYDHTVYDAIDRRDAKKTLDTVIVSHMKSNPLDTQEAVGRMYGVSQSYIHKLASNHGLTPDRKTIVKLSESDMEDIRRRRDEGEAVTTIAKSYGVVSDTIHKRLRK